MARRELHRRRPDAAVATSYARCTLKARMSSKPEAYWHAAKARTCVEGDACFDDWLAHEVRQVVVVVVGGGGVGGGGRRRGHHHVGDVNALRGIFCVYLKAAAETR